METITFSITKDQKEALQQIIVMLGGLDADTFWDHVPAVLLEPVASALIALETAIN